MRRRRRRIPRRGRDDAEMGRALHDMTAELDGLHSEYVRNGKILQPGPGEPTAADKVSVFLAEFARVYGEIASRARPSQPWRGPDAPGARSRREKATREPGSGVVTGKRGEAIPCGAYLLVDVSPEEAEHIARAERRGLVRYMHSLEDLVRTPPSGKRLPTAGSYQASHALVLTETSPGETRSVTRREAYAKGGIYQGGRRVGRIGRWMRVVGVAEKAETRREPVPASNEEARGATPGSSRARPSRPKSVLPELTRRNVEALRALDDLSRDLSSLSWRPVRAGGLVHPAPEHPTVLERVEAHVKGFAEAWGKLAGWEAGGVAEANRRMRCEHRTEEGTNDER